MFRSILVLISIFAISACSPDAERVAANVASGPEVEVINGLMEAFNDHDAERMRAFWHDDVVWLELAGNGASIVTQSADELQKELEAYFETYPEVRSTLDQITVNGNYLTAVETPVWKQGEEFQSNSSVVVYEFVDDKVKRFWYYPPQ